MSVDAACPFKLPFSDLVPRLLTSIWQALADLCKEDRNTEEKNHEIINRHFAWVLKLPRGTYQHLFTSRVPNRSLRTVDSTHPTRISRLIISAFRCADRQPAQNPHGCLPSPLKILLDYLTVPWEPASRSYAFSTLRQLLFEQFRLWPEAKRVPDGFREFSQWDVEEQLAVIDTYFQGRDNVPIGGSDVKVLLCHVLAMQGSMVLRFGTRRNKSSEDPEAARLRYCQNARLAPDDGYEFTIDDRIQRLPRAAVLINELWGVPLPIRGADTVFFGGLRSSSEGGLVMAVAGGPGTGKTSLALGLSAVLEPLGTRTFYVSAEESSADLFVRRNSLVPTFLRHLQGSRYAEKEQFRAERIPPKEDGRHSSNTLSEMLTEIKRLTAQEWASGPDLPLPCPLIIVIDGVHLYLRGPTLRGPTYPLLEQEDAFAFVRFIHDCRSLGALVILTWGSEPEVLGVFDYLVDILLRLEYRYTERPDEEPLRIMELIKTRHQISRPGAHVFHISASRGIRLSPELPSQLNQKALLKVRRPDHSCGIDVLNRTFMIEQLPYLGPGTGRSEKMEIIPKRFLDIPCGSHVLVHGRNSACKSGFSLKLLMGPVVDRKTRKPVRDRGSHRIFVVSFLYPEPYYRDLADRLERLKALECSELNLPRVSRRDVEVLHFFPGYLNPEDVATKILRRLEQADLEGEPFTGVLLDGVHNVFLQFPRLEQSPMIWPMLYGLFRRRDLTVVTTHTTITVRETDDPKDEQDLGLRKAVPLLHAIVQGTDIFLIVNEIVPSRKEKEAQEVRYEIRVHVAEGQPKPTGPVYWHREKLVVYRIARQQEMAFGNDRDEVSDSA